MEKLKNHLGKVHDKTIGCFRYQAMQITAKFGEQDYVTYACDGGKLMSNNLTWMKPHIGSRHQMELKIQRREKKMTDQTLEVAEDGDGSLHNLKNNDVTLQQAEIQLGAIQTESENERRPDQEEEYNENPTAEEKDDHAECVHEEEDIEFMDEYNVQINTYLE